MGEAVVDEVEFPRERARKVADVGLEEGAVVEALRAGRPMGRGSRDAEDTT
jgi:hypothetical protein